MNSTIDDSKNKLYIVGLGAVPQKEGTKIIEVPPKEIGSAEAVLDYIIAEQLQEIKLKDGRAEEVLSKEQIKELEENRKNRKTERAKQRRNANQR